MAVSVIKGNNKLDLGTPNRPVAPNVNDGSAIGESIKASKPEAVLKQAQDSTQKQLSTSSVFQSQASHNSDAVQNNVRSAFKSERIQQRLRDPKEAVKLADEVADKIRGTHKSEALDSHRRLDPLETGPHLAN